MVVCCWNLLAQLCLSAARCKPVCLVVLPTRCCWQCLPHPSAGEMNDGGEVLLTLYEAIDSVAQVGRGQRDGGRLEE